MNYIFYFLIVISIIVGAINGKLQEVTNAVMDGAELSVKVAFSLIGIMAFWLGIMRIAQKSGIIDWIAKVIKPITKVLFNEIPPESDAELYCKCLWVIKCGDSIRVKSNGRIAKRK